METKKNKTDKKNETKKLSKIGEYWQSDLYKTLSKNVRIDYRAVLK